MKLSKLLAIARKINEIRQINDYPLLPSYLRFFKLVTVGQYSPVEIFMEDLLNPGWTREERAGMISMESFLQLQQQVNPRAYRYLTEDKIAFHHYCIKKGLPVPELVAAYDPGGNSSWGNGAPIGSDDELLQGLARYPFSIIAKPVHGAHGNGVIRLDFIDGKHRSATHSHLSLAESLSSIFAPGGDQYILQQALYSHQAIVDFTNNPTLQGLRLRAMCAVWKSPTAVAYSVG